ncbi:uncharacterized protein MONBRDRAFT_36939 [Monosiga brevicollis MX1]|uniref:DNA damage-binding protein 1 n=1 Tax=Monosiga brevicollis TaxID=81824 RepID=A9UYJ0_MONBE|nr:uncharacterized protein MONBRDRAFT_36939 [Monosiga brevicollis MX1]EDQ89470.1 predicted protein [Monosiga brevicollis MX1]|eukprot:XP_001745499.1 hypothetical protein [Monosiga brevicollis MX1]
MRALTSSLSALAVGHCGLIAATEIFGLIRDLRAFRLTGGTKDYLIVSTDSGRITILQYDVTANKLERVHMETFGKSGCRRIVPGQYLATDPKGRAVMVGAVEKQKLVYILNRDAAARLTISSPLEAHKGHSLVYDMVGVDVGFENPLFACLELDYEDVDEDPSGEALELLAQTLVFYELDLGLNHVVRKESIELDSFANKLIPVPGGADGPSGVLVCGDGQITWRTVGEHTPISVSIPRRLDPFRQPRSTIINAFCMHKTKKTFFFLLQTEEGDLFKLTMVHDEDEVQGMILKYFDTVPVAKSMVLLKIGLLFIASEHGDHQLYQIAQLGDNKDEPSFLSTEPEDKVLYFRPRPLLNLAPLDVIESLAPVMDCQLADAGQQDGPQLYALCGRGSGSSLRVLRHGLEVSAMAESPLPGNPSAVWSVKRHVEDEADTYIVMSFVDATLVLGIGETVEEVTDSGFLGSVATLSASRIGDDALLQIHAMGIRHILHDGRINEWKAPDRTKISHCAVNERQAVVALSNGELVYFELDRSGQLIEHSERVEMSSQVTALALAPIPEGAQTARFLALGLDDQTVRLMSLDKSDCLAPLSMQALPGAAASLCMVEVRGTHGEPSGLSLAIGLGNGVLMRSRVDTLTADLSDTRTRYLGARAVKLFPVKVAEEPAVLALSTKPWLSYRYQGHSRITPLSYDALEYASAFSSDQCPEGVAAVAGNTLRIFAFEKLGQVFHQNSIPLEYTGRRLLLDPEASLAFIAEGDQGCLSVTAKAERLSRIASHQAGTAMAEQTDPQEDLTSPAALAEPLDVKQFGQSYAGDNLWASNIRVVNLAQGETTCLVPLAQDEMVMSLARVRFASSPNDKHIVAGVVKGWKPKQQSMDGAFLLTFQVQGDQVVLLHRTAVDGGLPCALAEFAGKVLAGVGNTLRIFDLGKKKLLLKTENRQLPSQVVHITTMGTRICAADQKHSFVWLKYKPAENALTIFADDTNPRWCTRGVLLDYQTVAGADKFGNFVVARLGTDLTDQIDDDPTGSKAFWSRGILNGASQKMDILCNYHVGETILSLQKVTLVPGGAECILYTTMSGGIGLFLPFSNRDDFEFFTSLELHLRQEHAPLCGRDHLHYRSAYFPVKSVIDGDLCEQYPLLSASVKNEVAEGLERPTTDVIKKIEDIRNRFAF